MPNKCEQLGEVNILITPDDCDFISLGEDTLLFEKEHAYVGKFAMNAGKENQLDFELTEELIDHFVHESNRYIENGNKCNLPVEHTTDPEKNRGEVKRWYKKPDSKGRTGLFSLTEFRDAEAAKLARTAHTSIFAPPTYTDGGKNTYIRPIRHVALTDYPVIPGLDRFTPIAASLIDSSKEKGSVMPIKDLAASIGLQLSEEVVKDETKAFEAIKSHVDQQNIKLSETEKAFEDYKKLNPPKTDPVRVSKQQVAMLRENRELKLSQLVKEGRILTCVAKQLEDLFCSESILTLALSEDTDDNFDKVIKALKDNDLIKLSEETGPQGGSLSTLNPETNPLLANAKKLAAARN